MLNSLVAYRGKAAKIIETIDDKFLIELEDKKTVKVRKKDFRFLSPNFTIPIKNLTADLEILPELTEETLTIEELSQWIFGEYSSSSAWNLFELVEDGLYFYWQKDKIFIRPTEQVEKIKAKREQEEKEELLLQNFLQSIVAKTYHQDDLPFIEEIYKVATNQLKSAKVLKYLKIPNTSESAYKLLVDIGYLKLTDNIYPIRNNIYQAQEIEVKEQEETRVDLTHFTSYAIDNTGSNDADDAIAIVGDTIWISIADVGSFVDDKLLEYAENRISNLYLPNEIIPMLPEIITQKCALKGVCSALSIGFKLSDDCENISEIEVVKTKVNIENISYDEVDKTIPSDFLKYYQLAEKHKAYRKKNGAFSLDLPKVDVRLKDEIVLLLPQKNTKARLMVAEFMILAGRVMSEFLITNQIPAPFVSQEAGNFSDEILNAESLSLSQSWASTKGFKRSTTSTTPNSHFGLGLNKYTRITSPLRRYLDLLTHTQITNFIQQQPLLTDKEIKQKISIHNNNLQKINLTTRESNTHYKFLYILQNKNEVFDATIIGNAGSKKLIMIEKLAMIQAIKTDKNLDDKIVVKFSDIDIFKQELSVKVLK